ncbi:MAG: FtsX-like permease family protein [Zoogloeaceae bacterium]|jgi:putative ABC transport system permease protein|nr:FtsX-like permease family protein [Zoogloeaceae bacterium]
MKALLLAWKNVLRNRRRSLVTILIAAVGCAAILVASGFALHTYEMLIEGAVHEYGHITLAHPDFFDREEDSPLQFGVIGHEALMTRLAFDNRVVDILPRVSFSGLISNGDKSLVFLGTGADLLRESQNRGQFFGLVSGSIRIPADKKEGNIYALVGAALARSLGARPGDSLTLLATTTSGSLNAMDVEVSGLVSTGWEELDKRLVYIDVALAQRLLMTDRVSTLSVYLKKLKDVEGFRADLLATAPGLALRTWQQQAFYYLSVKSLYNRIFGLLGLIIAALVLFSVINTLAMAVVERTREIGTLRALGTYPAEIVAQFMREGFLIGLSGVILGNLLTGAIIWSLPYFALEMPPPPGRSEGYPLLVSASLPLYVVTNLLIILLCVGAAWAVSRRAARNPIVEALGHV